MISVMLFFCLDNVCQAMLNIKSTVIFCKATFFLLHSHVLRHGNTKLAKNMTFLLSGVKIFWNTHIGSLILSLDPSGSAMKIQVKFIFSGYQLGLHGNKEQDVNSVLNPIKLSS